MFDRISNAFGLAKASWRVLSKDRELIAVPILSGLAALLLALVLALPAIATAGNETSSANAVTVLSLIAAGLGVAWMTAVGQAAIVAGAAERMDGGDPTISSAFEVARARGWRLFEWAVLATVVAVVLDQLEERLGILGNILSWVGSIAWSVMSFLALPVIVFEDVGAIEGFKRSSAMVRGTWGEQVTFSFGMGLIGLVAMLPGLLVAAALISAGGVIAGIGIMLGVVWFIGVAATTSALSAVFKTALYRWATGKPVDEAFDNASFQGAFVPRGQRRGLI